MAASSRAFARHDPRQARARLTIALGVGVAVALLVPDRFGVALRAVAGWDAAAFSMGALAWALIFRAGSDPKRTRRHAADDDPGRRVVWVIAILASGFSLFATAVVLRNARTCPLEWRPTFVLLCLAAVDHQPADPARRAGARGPVVRLQHDDRRDRRQPRRRLHRLTARPPSPTRR